MLLWIENLVLQTDVCDSITESENKTENVVLKLTGKQVDWFSSHIKLQSP